MTIARRLVQAAGSFERYVRNTTAISPDFDDAARVSAAVMASASYEPRQLEEGAVAYAAMVALQEPTFARGLSSLAKDPSASAAFVERLKSAPEQILEAPGAWQAAGLASAALDDMGSDLLERGHAVKQAAYTIQRQPWSQQPVDEPAARLSRVKARSQAPGTLTDAETQRLLAKVVAYRSASGVAPQPAPAPAIVRGLALAAAAMLGQAGEQGADALGPLLTDLGARGCLKMAKLNLHQCLAVAGPQYEDVFCAGEHAMADTGQCIVNAARGQTARGAPTPVAQPRAAMAVSVPVALGAEAQTAYGARPSADTSGINVSDTVE
ncbi:hypothetical protein LJR225_001867 [Phenylobacterium sp. LjRoot225]|uniref:hypothetical protein n=1 Tax=Phenylobacterium sp. LjRoot225 TaxID=3342285 RepID=UPI003ED0FFEB